MGAGGGKGEAVIAAAEAAIAASGTQVCLKRPAKETYKRDLLLLLLRKLPLLQVAPRSLL
jgi:hypothetical protein